jgi:hypothetical protein
MKCAGLGANKPLTENCVFFAWDSSRGSFFTAVQCILIASFLKDGICYQQVGFMSWLQSIVQ